MGFTSEEISNLRGESEINEMTRGEKGASGKNRREISEGASAKGKVG